MSWFLRNDAINKFRYSSCNWLLVLVCHARLRTLNRDGNALGSDFLPNEYCHAIILLSRERVEQLAKSETTEYCLSVDVVDVKVKERNLRNTNIG